MISNKNEITIIRPDDFHLHLRDDEIMKTVLPHTAHVFARAIIMPNLKPPIISLKDVFEYKKRITDNIARDYDFEPLMTIYLTQNHKPKDIEEFAKSGLVKAVKLYPCNATTNSQYGVRDFDKIIDALQTLSQMKIPLLVHGESTEKGIDVFDREKRFIDTIFSKKLLKIDGLKIVFEHITTKEAVDFVLENEIAATIAPQHLLMNRNAIFDDGINPHNYCLPVLKRENHRKALLEAISKPIKKFFLGTDSAPHTKNAKESSCGCAGIYSAFAAIPLYAEAFEEAGALYNFENFCSKNGADFYGLPYNNGVITIVKETWTAPSAFKVNNDTSIIPLRAQKEIKWKIK
ncbi:MAG: dihydroorotase [Chitinispirillales bacterium]|jgi:dihydroorotase|nr:dihydroorotase [Chitinispirillales bacterium]